MTAPAVGFASGRAAQLDALRAVVASVPARLPRFPATSRLLLVGIGASHAALASPLHQLRAAGVTAYRSTGADFPGPVEGAADLAIAVSASGRSRETVDLVRRLAAAGVATWALTNTDDNPLRAVAGSGVGLGGFADSRVSTVGFVVTYAALGMLADTLIDGAVHPGWARLPDLIAAAVPAAQDVLAAFARRWLVDGAVDVVAAASQLTASEAVALLLREGPLVPAASYDTRSYLHGPMDCAGQATSHLVLGDEREHQLAHQLRQKPTGVLVLTASDGPAAADAYRIRVPDGLTVAQRALLEVCVLQELVAETAAVRGNPVDEVAFTRQDTKLEVR